MPDEQSPTNFLDTEITFGSTGDPIFTEDSAVANAYQTYLAILQQEHPEEYLRQFKYCDRYIRNHTGLNPDEIRRAHLPL